MRREATHQRPSCRKTAANRNTGVPYLWYTSLGYSYASLRCSLQAREGETRGTELAAAGHVEEYAGGGVRGEEDAVDGGG